MANKSKKRYSLWERLTFFPRFFSYEVNPPLEEVIQNLANLEQKYQILGGHSQDISILPRDDHYTFRLRRGRLGTFAAEAEGEIWENAAGRVVIEGEARSNAIPMFLSVLMLLLPTILCTMAFQQTCGVIPVIILFGAAGFDLLGILQGRQEMIMQISAAVEPLRKMKRQTDTRLSLPENQSIEDQTALQDELRSIQRGPREL